MQGPPPPLPNLEPIAAEVRTAEEDVLHRLDRKETQRELPQAADMVHKFEDLAEALVEDQARRREEAKARDDEVKRSPGKANQHSSGERETRRPSRSERRR